MWEIKSFWWYLIPFVFYPPLKCGSYFCRTLYYEEIECFSMVWAAQGMAGKCVRWPKKWAAKNAKDRCKRGHSTNLGALRSKIRSETNSRRRLLESVQRRRPGFWPDKWIHHHENAPAINALRVLKLLAKKSIKKKGHPPHSLDLAPLHFSSKIKNCTEGTKICWHFWYPM
jgi:hypothetical protein